MNNKDKQTFILEIINPDTKKDRLLGMILMAEDMEFTVEQSKILSPWLLNFAKEYRDIDSKNSRYKCVVWSAIRTGASMLTPDYVGFIDNLIPLLEQNHRIPTMLVVIKMVGRIFEAQPPKEIDKYEKMAKEIYNIIESIINKETVNYHREAIIGLSINALAAMGSSSIKQIIKKIIKDKEAWFIQMCLKELKKLRQKWENNFKIEPQEPLILLNEVIYQLAK